MARILATISLALAMLLLLPSCAGQAVQDPSSEPTCTEDGARGGGSTCTDAASDLAQRGDDDADVRASGIPGAGLGAFARRAFARGDAVGRYRCAPRPASSASLYSVTLNATHACDAEAISPHNPMRYVNSVAALDTCGRLNVEIRIAAAGDSGSDGTTDADDDANAVTYVATRAGDSGSDGTTDADDDANAVTYVATRALEAGEELVADYGEEYFKINGAMVAAGVVYECGMPARIMKRR